MTLCRLTMLAVAGGAVACGPLRPEALPHRFSQSLLAEQEHTAAARRAPPRRRPAKPPVRRTPEPWRSAATARARQLVGRPFPGDEATAAAALLAAVFGERSAPNGATVQPRRRAPRPADLVVFSTGRAPIRKLGVVLSCSGPRIVFLHLRAGKAQLGWLHTGQPNRRRLPGDARVANSYVRVKRPDDPPGTRYLAAQLLAGFAAPPPPSGAVAVGAASGAIASPHGAL